KGSLHLSRHLLVVVGSLPLCAPRGRSASAGRYTARARGAVRFRTGSDPGGSSPKDPSPVPRTFARTLPACPAASSHGSTTRATARAPCDPDCWCRRTALGRAVKWWFPGRLFGLKHKGRWNTPEWKRAHNLG